jgi:GPH family glycoside/pentoside/hexuronide:cation symporter
VLAAFHYNGQDSSAIEGAVPGIIMLMSWIPALIALLGAVLMGIYPLNQDKMDAITLELNRRRKAAGTLSTEIK